MTDIASAPPRIGLPTKLFYGLGSVAFGVKDAGFQTFLLLFYNQLVGLPSQWVSGAIALALIVDACVDPIVGQVSDHWRSRWGRRHPFMYAAALPVAVSYLLLWNPPHASHAVLFVYILVTAVIVRTFITFYEIPSSALVAELTNSYDQRTNMPELPLRVRLAGRPGHDPDGLFWSSCAPRRSILRANLAQSAGYSQYGMMSAAVMLLAIVVSAAGTHRFIPFLRKPEGEKQPLGQLGREMLSTLSHRSFLMMLGVGLFAAMGQGLNFALALYLGTFFWELSSAQISILVVQGFVGAMAAAVLAPYISRKIGKKAAALGTLTLSICTGATPFLCCAWRAYSRPTTRRPCCRRCCSSAPHLVARHRRLDP